MMTFVLPAAYGQELPREELIVHLTDGRTFTGSLDTRTNNQYVTLRSGTAAVEILRKIDWSDVRQIEEPDGTDVTSEVLRDSQRERSANKTTTWQLSRVDTAGDARGAGRTADERAQFAHYAPQRMMAIECEAMLGNWDADAQPDGLLLKLVALDESGQAMAFSGTLDVQLIAPLGRRFHEAPHARGHSLEPIASWHVYVTPPHASAAQQHDEHSILVELPWQAIDPLGNWQVGSFGLVQVRLAALGQGVFERVLYDLRIRPYSSLADLGHER